MIALDVSEAFLKLWPVLILAIPIIMSIYAEKRLHMVAVGALTSEQMIDGFFRSFETIIKTLIARLTSLLVAICWPLAVLLGLAGLVLWAAGDRLHGQRLLFGALLLVTLALIAT